MSGLPLGSTVIYHPLPCLKFPPHHLLQISICARGELCRDRLGLFLFLSGFSFLGIGCGFPFFFLGAGRFTVRRYGVRERETPATRAGYATFIFMTGGWVGNKSTEGGLWVKVVAEVSEVR